MNQVSCRKIDVKVTHCPHVHTIYYKEKEIKEILVCVALIIDADADAVIDVVVDGAVAITAVVAAAITAVVAAVITAVVAAVITAAQTALLEPALMKVMQ